MSAKRELVSQIKKLNKDQIKYINLCFPEFVDIANLALASEKKYGEGLHCSEKDSLKALGHLSKAIQGVVNPDDGSDGSEFRAVALRTIKSMKFEKIIK